jgi:hypothetical protein
MIDSRFHYKSLLEEYVKMHQMDSHLSSLVRYVGPLYQAMELQPIPMGMEILAQVPVIIETPPKK